MDLPHTLIAVLGFAVVILLAVQLGRVVERHLWERVTLRRRLGIVG